MNNLEGCGVKEATHVKVGGRIEKITSKYGIDQNGRLAKPSEGGFGVVTEGGKTADMWEAELYFREK